MLATSSDQDVEPAARALYRACQLRLPRLLVARDAAEYGRLVGLAHRAMPPFALLLPLQVTIGAGAVGFMLLLKPARADGILLLLTAGLGLFAAVAPVVIMRPERSAMPWLQWLGAAGAIAVVGAAGLIGLVLTAELPLAASAMALAGPLVLLIQMLDQPVRRLRLGLPIAGCVSVRDGVAARLEAARQDIGEGAALLPPAHEPRPELAAEITRYLERAAGWGAAALRPILGCAMTRWDRPLVRPLDPPLLLAVAATLDDRCAAVTVLDRAVIVLPMHAAAARPGDPLAVLGLAPTLVRLLQRLPPWLSARIIVAEPDPVLRLRAIEAFGPERLVRVLKSRPVDQSPRGRLYVLGQPAAPTALVRVVDLVRGPRGSEQVHWIPVPPHLATAHEAVAWTFHKGPAGYAPQHES